MYMYAHLRSVRRRWLVRVGHGIIMTQQLAANTWMLGRA